jgi:hypothetical protein
MVLVVRFQAFRVRVRNISLGKMSRLELSRAPFVCECVHTMAFFSCALSLAFFYRLMSVPRTPHLLFIAHITSLLLIPYVTFWRCKRTNNNDDNFCKF